MALTECPDYQAHWCEPITGNYNGFQLWTVPAPASGAIWLAAMGILDRLELANANTAEAAHQISEVLRVSPHVDLNLTQNFSWHTGCERSLAIQDSILVSNSLNRVGSRTRL